MKLQSSDQWGILTAAQAGEKTCPPRPALPLTGAALESFRNFELKMYSEYQHMQKAFGFTVIEGNQPINQDVRKLKRQKAKNNALAFCSGG